MTKQELRSVIKSEIKENGGKLAEMSREVCAQILASDIYKNCPVLLAYSALEDEVDLSPVIEDALKKGKKVFLPHIKPGASYMTFLPFYEDTELCSGSFGILEPQSEDSAFELSDVFQVLALVPGRAFTIDGKRLGRGKGFYDQYFAEKTQNIHLAGVCFPFQIKEDIPTDSHDILMDFLF